MKFDGKDFYFVYKVLKERKKHALFDSLFMKASIKNTYYFLLGIFTPLKFILDVLIISFC